MIFNPLVLQSRQTKPNNDLRSDLLIVWNTLTCQFYSTVTTELIDFSKCLHNLEQYLMFEFFNKVITCMWVLVQYFVKSRSCIVIILLAKWQHHINDFYLQIPNNRHMSCFYKCVIAFCDNTIALNAVYFTTEKFCVATI